ncbi:MAG: hypothetical protein Q9168_002283 [Polycauliona sp. 1 TL-2023]
MEVSPTTRRRTHRFIYPAFIMLFFLVLSYILSLVASAVIPAATLSLAAPQSLSLTERALSFPPFTKSVTYNIPNSDVRLTLTSFFNGMIVNPERVRLLISHGLYALANSERDAGGSHKTVGWPAIDFKDFGLAISVIDETLRTPGKEGDGGKMQWGELRAIYQGVGAHFRDMENQEFKIDAWRMKTGGFPRMGRRIKHLATGTLRADRTGKTPATATA